MVRRKKLSKEVASSLGCYSPYSYQEAKRNNINNPGKCVPVRGTVPDASVVQVWGHLPLFIIPPTPYSVFRI